MFRGSGCRHSCDGVSFSLFPPAPHRDVWLRRMLHRQCQLLVSACVTWNATIQFTGHHRSAKNTVFPQSIYGHLSCIYVAGKEWKKNHILHQPWLYFELERQCDGRALLKLLLTAQVFPECGSLRDTRDDSVLFARPSSLRFFSFLMLSRMGEESDQLLLLLTSCYEVQLFLGFFFFLQFGFFGDTVFLRKDSDG